MVGERNMSEKENFENLELLRIETSEKWSVVTDNLERIIEVVH